MGKLYDYDERGENRFDISLTSRADFHFTAATFERLRERDGN